VARFEALVAMRWQDMDAYGHVNNVQFLTYVEEARVEMFQSAPLSGLDPVSSGVLVAASDIRYLKPLHHRHAPVPIDVWVTKVGAASFSLAYEVHDDDGTVYARASSVMVPYDFMAERPRRLTPEERDWLGKYVELPDEQPSGPGERAGR
jgi:acyl-CoA thioester hydrolase